MALQGSALEPHFGSIAANGCRCPARAGGVLIGVHHKTGTVLVEQVDTP